MNKIRIELALAASLLLLAGCGSLPSVAPVSEHQTELSDAKLARSILDQKAVCCIRFDELPYQQLDIGFDGYVPVNADNAAFAFDTGKSFVLAYRLPVNVGDFRITIESQFGNTVFSPTVTLLDSRFRETRTLGQEVFTYAQARFLKADRLEGSFSVDRRYVGNPNNESYLLIYTTEEALSGETTLVHPAKAYARATQVVEPNVADPVLPHSATGLLHLAVTPLTASEPHPHQYVPDYMADTNELTPEPHAVASQGPVAARPLDRAETFAESPRPAATMLPETEQFYNNAIRQAVDRGEIDKALHLVEEAERIGSASARDTFIRAVKAR